MAKISINKIIRNLIEVDLIFFSAFGLISPIFAIFITGQIKGGNVEVVGFAAGIYLVLRSLLQIPISKFLDKKRGEKDDFYFLILGHFLVALAPFGYIFSSFPWQIYALQVIYALGMAMAYPSWCAIFTRHIDKGKEAFEWGLDSTILGLGAGITGAIGGVLAAEFGFNLVFVIVGIFALFAAFLPLLIYKDIMPRGDHYLSPLRRKNHHF